jgi:hypothetical protein
MSAKKRSTGKGKRPPALPRHDRSLPAPENIVGVQNVVSPTGFKYQDIATNETDAYDPPLAGKKANEKDAKPKR